MRLSQLAAVLCVALAATAALQWHGNGYRAEWTSSADEPAHYVTGLMVRDYLAQGLPGGPLAYAQRYYDHYPKVGFGHWPPVFYLVQAGWTLLFGVSRPSLIALMAVITACLLTSCYAVARRYLPVWMSWALSTLLATLPMVEVLSRAVMAEMLVALLTFWSVVVLAWYLDAPRWQTAAWFGLVASATILTKATGFALAPLPLLAVLVSGRHRLLLTKAFWLPAVIVVGICGPWFAFVPYALHDRVARFGGPGFRGHRIQQSLRFLWDSFGWAGCVLILLGLIVVFRNPRPGEKRDPLWVLAGLLIVSTLGMRVAIGAWEARHLVNLAPLLVLLLGVGLGRVVELAFRNQSARIAMALAVLAGMVAWNIWRTPEKPYLGLDAVARDLAMAPQFANSRLLIVSDAIGEGVFISEIAALERRPGHVIKRGSQALASVGWMSGNYNLKFQSPAELMAYLEQEPSQAIVLDMPDGPVAHAELLRKTVDAYRDRWRLVGSYPRFGPGPPYGRKVQVLQLAY